MLPYGEKEPLPAPTRMIPRESTPSVMPDNKADEEAFYASHLYGENPKEDYQSSKFNLTTTGSDELVNNANYSWQQEQQEQDKIHVQDIISDPDLSIEHKKNIIQKYSEGSFISKNLRDKYKQTIAAQDSAVTQEDRSAQDTLINVLDSHFAKKQEVQDAITAYHASLDATVGSVAGGIALNFVPGYYGASSAGLSTTGYKPGVAEFLKSFILPGEGKKKLKDEYAAMNPDQKIERIKDIGDFLTSMPGSDFNRWQEFRDTVDTDLLDNPIFRHLENLAGVVDFFAAKGFISAGFANGFLKTSIKLAKYWTTPDFITKAKPAKSMQDRVDPHLGKTVTPGDPNPPTGTPPVEESVKNVYKAVPTTLDVPAITNINRPRVNPGSPLGTTAASNPKKANEVYTQAILDDSDTLAKSMGSDKGEVLADAMFPKLDESVEHFPDIADAIRNADKQMAENFKNIEYDPFFVPVTQREKDIAIMHQTMKENNGAHYQQSNSVVHETINNISGVGIYGRNESHGFSSADEAQASLEKLKTNLTVDEADKLSVIEKNNEFYVQHPFSIDYNNLDAFVLGPNAVNAKFSLPGMSKGVDISGFARSPLAKWVIPPTMRMDKWIPEGAMLATLKTIKVEADFMSLIKKEIQSVPHKFELDEMLTKVLEGGEWVPFSQIRKDYPHLNQAQAKKLYRGYSFYQRFTHYQHYLANRLDRSRLLDDNMEAMYDANGVLHGFASRSLNTTEFNAAKNIFDVDAQQGILKPAAGVDIHNRYYVRFKEPIHADGITYSHGIMGGQVQLKNLPETTLPRIEGYAPRKNIENFYVIKTPKELNLNGVKESNINVLREKYHKTIGAGRTKKEAYQLAAKLQKDYPDHLVEVKPERSDAGDAILTDYAVYKELQEHSRKRGERLPTLHGLARLENPLESIWGSVQSTVRMNVWDNYDSVFRKQWLKAYGHFTKGEFPNVLTDIKNTDVSEEGMKQFASAQRIFEQYAQQKYKVTQGDEIWKNTLHNLADTFEDVLPKWIHQNVKDLAGRGNLPVRSLKALGTTLFLHMNPIRQLLVQPQQLMVWNVIEPSYLKRSVADIPGITIALLSKATMVGEYGDVLYKSGRAFSGMSPKEFDDTFKAIYNTGLPHSVDLNMMLHGAFYEAKQVINPSIGSQVKDVVTNAVKAPGVIGKNIGYGPAELANTIGTWLFTRERWKKNNPGKDWNTPENIARITADAWDVSGSMTTRAGGMPYNDGVLGLFFQFAQYSHKKFAEMFMSKTLTPAERAKIAAANLVLYGKYGLPMGGVAAWMIGEHTDTLTQEQWLEFEGGLTDLLTNKLVDIGLRKPGEKESDLAISASVSPMPEYLPMADLVVNVRKHLAGDPTARPLPAAAAIGSIYKTAMEINNIFRVNEYNTELSLRQAGLELAKLSGGYNNYAKSAIQAQYGDQADKLGNFYGISTTRAQIAAQMFGIVSKEEQNLFRISDNNRARMDFIKTRSKEIHEALIRFEGRHSEPEYGEWVRAQKILMSFTPPEWRDEIESEVDKLDIRDFENRKESAYTNLLRNIKDTNNDKYVKQNLILLKNSKNPKDIEMLNTLDKAGLLTNE